MSGISFVIPTFNNVDLTINCVKSIISLDELKKVNYEIIVVDDFSSDKLFLKLNTDLLNLNFEKIIIVKNDKNMGPAYSRNRGVKHSKFDYIFFLDSDTEIQSGSLENFLKKIVTNDAVVGVYHYEPLNDGYFAHHKALLNYFYSHKNQDYYFTNFAAACAGIKKKVFNSLKGFNENIKWGMDYECEEFGHRIISNNYKLIVSSNTVIKHHFPKGLKSINLYFIRVSNWVGFYLSTKKFFDKTAATTPKVALGCISGSLVFFFALLYFFFNNFFYFFLLILFFVLYIFIFFEFFIFTLKKNRGMFLGIFLLNFIISNVISLSSFFGILKFIKRKIIN